MPGRGTRVRFVCVYGQSALTVEQINSAEKALYLHHDQAGSTRLLTGSAGTVEGKCSYGAYGTTSCEGTATTPLGDRGPIHQQRYGAHLSAGSCLRPSDSRVSRVSTHSSPSRERRTIMQAMTLSTSRDPSGLIFGIPGTPSATEIAKSISRVAGGVALGASVAAVGCAAGAAPTVIGEVACGGVGAVALAAGSAATAADGYLAATGAQSPLPAVYDGLGLGTGVGSGILDGALGESELGAYAKIYSWLLSAIAYGGAYAESAFGCG